MDAYLTGLPGIANPPGSGPAGDAGEGPDLPVAIVGRNDRSGGRYTPLPGVLPTRDHLEYVQRFSAAALLAIGLLLLIAVGILNPRRAVGFVARGAQRQAGMA